jgi:O-antigen/teichoic acid export membrane protein
MWFFGGKEFEQDYVSLIILAILVFTVSLGTWQYDQLFLPLGKEKIGLKCQVFMAIISIVSNILFIPKWGYIGASISLAIAEISGTVYGVWYAKNKIHEVKINYINKSLVKYIFASCIMSVSIMLFKLLKYGYILNIVFGIFIGSVVYFGILCFTNDDICKGYVNYFLNKIKRNSLKQ